MRLDLTEAHRAVQGVAGVEVAGRVLRAVGGVVEATGPRVPVGEHCVIAGRTAIAAEVVGFRSDAILLMPLGNAEGIAPGARVTSQRRPLAVRVGPGLLGRILDGLGRPIDGLGPVRGTLRPIAAAPPAPLARRRIDTPLGTGVRAIDGLLTSGQGQRLGVFAGSGVGKSILLGMIARHAAADVNVIALVGERGREVRDFLERDLGPGLERSVVVVATAEQPPLVRIKAAMVALTMAEAFRENGAQVLFMMDSLTRVVMAQREIGLAAGEPPTTKGYPPSAFTLLPQLLERVGATRQGSITGFFAVLVEGDDLSEPVSDAARSVLDGHITLARRLAQMNHYPAVDVLASVSRVMPQVVSAEHRGAADAIRRSLAIYAEAEDVINLGAYVSGTNAELDDVLRRLPAIRAFLCQPPEEGTPLAETEARLLALAAQAPEITAPGPVPGKNGGEPLARGVSAGRSA